MLKIEAEDEKVKQLDMHGTIDVLANEMIESLQKFSEKILKSAQPGDRKELATKLATCWALATKVALDEVQSHDER